MVSTVTVPLLLSRARAYLSRMPPSIQGSRGSDALYAVAVVLVKGFSLPEAEAFHLLAEWNEARATPPWSVPELQHKLKSAAGSRRPQGWLLDESRPSLPNRRSRLRPRAVSSAAPVSSAPPPAPPAEDNPKARLRAAWPRFSSLVREDVETIAALRHLSFEAVDTARLCSFVTTGTVDGHRCYIIREETFAQARRFDGLPFTLKDGTTIKAKNLPGSEGHFIGTHRLGWSTDPVLIVEGAISLLEAVGAANAVGQDLCLTGGWATLAAVSASSRFDHELLETLAGRRVRIVPDADPAGLRAAAIWTRSLRAAGATVDAFRLPPGIKDLGPLAADPVTHRATLQRLFSL